MAPAPPLMTVGEYFRTPETLAPSELAHGVLRVADAPTAIHQSRVAQLFMALHAHVAERRLGRVWLSPLDVVLDEANALIVQPDLMFISNAESGSSGPCARGSGPCHRGVVTASESRSNEEHLLWFAKHGVRECWLVYQECEAGGRHLLRRRAVGEPRVFGPQEKIKSSVLPDFSMSLRRFSISSGYRSSLRTTSFKPDHTSSTAHTFTSTNPSGSATSRTVSSVISVGTFDDFFGHDTHTTASGASVWR
jgi:hypothetical protein